MKKIYEKPMLNWELSCPADVLTLSLLENGRDDERSWSEGV